MISANYNTYVYPDRQSRTGNPLTARFLSAAPFVPNPFSSQDYNRVYGNTDAEFAWGWNYLLNFTYS